ncbi:MAG: hypothetical protein U1F43_16975 [Myxococcota bacterium]
MGWSYEDNRFEITACEPKDARAGSPVTLAIGGQNRGAHRAADGWFAMLVPTAAGARPSAADEMPPHHRASPVAYRHGDGDDFAMQATFALPPDASGTYQLVVGHGNDLSVGDFARFLVDAGDFDGVFVVR